MTEFEKSLQTFVKKHARWLFAFSVLKAAVTAGVLASFASGATGCGMTKDLDDMHDSTGAMAVTTSQMNDKMDKLADMDTQMTAMNTQMSKMVDTMSTMGSNMDSMQKTMTDMDSLMGQLTAMNQSMGAMKDALGTMITTLSTMNSTMSVMPKMGDSLNHMDTMMGSLDTMMGDLDKKMDALPAVSKTLTGMNGQIGSMRGVLSGMRGDLGILKSVNDSLGTMKTGVGNLQTDIQSLNGLATDLATDMKPAVALGARQQALTRMEAEPSLSQKFRDAAAYFEAFDFQTIKGTETTQQAAEDTLRMNAVQDFFLLLTGYTHKLDQPGIPNFMVAAFPNNDMANLLALGGALDAMYFNQIARQNALKNTLNWLGTPPSKFLSMWGMIEETLARESAIQAGATANPWENEVLKNRENAVYIAQLRANILASVTFQNLSKLPENAATLTDWIQQKLTGTRDFAAEWEASVGGKTLQTLSDTYTALAKANEAREFMIAHGIAPQLDPMVKRSLSNCKIPVGQAGTTMDREAVLVKLRDLLKKFSS